ncbi:MAG TPA: ATP-binding protein [Actinocrinis sp.]|nr:ATP-binding protein [Actinocrinis sp.]
MSAGVVAGPVRRSARPRAEAVSVDVRRRRGPGGRRGWTTRTWLTVGMCVALTVLLALSALAVWLFVHNTRISDQLIGRSFPAQIAASRLETAMVNQETGIRGYGLTGQTDFLQPYQTGLTDEQQSIATLRPLIGDDPQAQADLALVLARIHTWQTDTADPIAAWPPGKPSPLAAQEADAGKNQFDALRGAMTAQQQNLKAAGAADEAAIQQTRHLRTWVFSGIGLVILAMCALVFVGLRRGITRPLELLSRDVRKVADGAFDHPVTAYGPADLRALSEDVEAMRTKLATSLAESAQSRVLLANQADDLRRSNNELEQFAYVASHDLQEPLRKVASFCQLLQRRYGGQLDERADQYIKFAVDGAHRMQTLINDLLAFSRVGRVLASHQTVDLEATLAGVVDGLSVAIEESGAVITHDPLPQVEGEPGQLDMLLHNLIGNAVKFRRPGEHPHVHVEAVRDGAMWRLAVSDDGIGIEPEYGEKIFVIFQRLHSREAYPGTGIGLAMCKKIVEFHGGTIAVDPDHAPGTRFVFTLPAEQGETESEGVVGDDGVGLGEAGPVAG